MKQTDPQIDPKGLIHDAYRMEEITPGECRSVFLDWALSLPEGQDSAEAMRRLMNRLGSAAPGHPMTDVLQEGLTGAVQPRRRGGWRARPRGKG